jgi:hypothetical protein
MSLLPPARATTGSGGEPSRRPARPALVEVAAAILIVGGVISLLSSIEVVATFAQRSQADLGISLLSVAIGAGLLVLGILVRYGRAWLLTVNVVAVVAFLELISGTIVGLFFGGLDVFVVLALFYERPWFQWRPPGLDGT